MVEGQSAILAHDANVLARHSTYLTSKLSSIESCEGCEGKICLQSRRVGEKKGEPLQKLGKTSGPRI